LKRNLANPLEIFQLLEKSNCKKCGEKTCLAFASAVVMGKRKLRECPQLPTEIIAQFIEEPKDRQANEPGSEYIAKLKSKIPLIDLAEAADRVGGIFSDGRLTLKILGKDYSVDSKGNIYADIHINPWIAVPFLNYTLYGEGVTVANKWVSLRELKNGRTRDKMFQRQCEEPMKRVADIYPDLFNDIVEIFSGKQVSKHLDSDISVVLYPLPKVPIMICYWLPDDGLDSILHVFFDETADQNLDTDSVFTLGTGLANMFKKFALRHGFAA
jgi:Domain of unknown function (DUF3786)/Putative Fe-S cluster